MLAPMSNPLVSELAHVPLFKTLTHTQLEKLAEHMETEPFRAGQRLAREGVAGYAFYIVRSGAAQVTVGDVVVGQLGEYDFFGELAMLGDGRRHATVTATEDGVAWSMFGTTFRALEEEHPEIASAIGDVARDRQETDDRLTSH